MSLNDPTAIAIELLTLLLAAGGLLIALGKNRVRREELDNLGLQAAVEMAKLTPELEIKLRETSEQLVRAQHDAQGCQDRVTELETLVRAQTEEIRQLKADNLRLADQVEALRLSLQSTRTAPLNP